MAANKLIQQPDILNLDSLGAFMDAQNDPIPTEEEKEVTTIEDTASDADVQDESSEVIQVDTTPQRPKVTRARRGRQTNVQPGQMCNPSSRQVLVNGTLCSDTLSSTTTIPMKTGLP